MKKLLGCRRIEPVNACRELRQVVEGFVELMRAGDEELMVLAALSTAGNYLYAHSVNVAILVLKVALGLHAPSHQCLDGWDREQVILLGMAALLHDVGMVQWSDPSRQNRAFALDEGEETRLHAFEDAQLLGQMRDMQRSMMMVLAATIGDSKEKLDQGPAIQETRSAPLGLQVISLCGLYEALTHYRAWREPNLPHDAINLLLKRRRGQFDNDMFKLFVYQLSFYPPGSFVRLSNNEVGRVLGVHASSVASPLVEIWVKNDGREQNPRALLDLSKVSGIWVECCVDETKIETDDKELLERLRANRWWPT